MIQRAFLRFFKGYSRLAIQLSIAVLCLGATAAGARMLAGGLLGPGPPMQPDDWFALALTVVAVLATGAWLGSCFPHWKRPSLLLTWLLIVLSVPLLGSVRDATVTLSENGGARGASSLPDFASEFGHRVVAEFRGRAPATRWLMLLVAMELLLSPLGVVLIVLNRTLVRAKARRFRRILRGSKGPR
ncbi:MAG: hypothetical protein ACI89L_001413 [Phycisphaerales bacterium]